MYRWQQCCIVYGTGDFYQYGTPVYSRYSTQVSAIADESARRGALRPSHKATHSVLQTVDGRWLVDRSRMKLTTLEMVDVSWRNVEFWVWSFTRKCHFLWRDRIPLNIAMLASRISPVKPLYEKKLSIGSLFS